MNDIVTFEDGSGLILEDGCVIAVRSDNGPWMKPDQQRVYFDREGDTVIACVPTPLPDTAVPAGMPLDFVLIWLVLLGAAIFSRLSAGR